MDAIFLDSFEKQNNCHRQLRRKHEIRTRYPDTRDTMKPHGKFLKLFVCRKIGYPES